MCYNEGELMAYLDGQLAPKEVAGVAAHVSRCSRCSQRLEVLSAEREEVATILEPYRVAVEGSTRPATPEGGKPFRALRDASPGKTELIVKKGVLRGMKQKALAAAVAVAMIVGLFSFGPVRSFAAQFLQVFRVNQLQVVHFNAGDVQELQKALQTVKA